MATGNLQSSQRKSLADRVKEELNASSSGSAPSFAVQGVSLGGATYTKMLGKRYV